LPALLLQGLKSPALGVMVARGDLAVEVGYERLAELQEEILWLCEAAHVPVIWATQVLEQMARTGTPSRAEVTDAAGGGERGGMEEDAGGAGEGHGSGKSRGDRGRASGRAGSDRTYKRPWG
jgi:hypothetical protein